MTKGITCICLLFTIACGYSSSAKRAWEISYRRVDPFLGGIIIKIGTDSCYYKSEAGINKEPLIVKWNASRKKLVDLYRQIEKLKLQDCSPSMASVTEPPFETLQLVENDRVIFSLQKQQQSEAAVKKFDAAVAILKSFASAEHGWKY